jgi:hypothetical protein
LESSHGRWKPHMVVWSLTWLLDINDFLNYTEGC